MVDEGFHLASDRIGGYVPGDLPEMGLEKARVVQPALIFLLSGLDVAPMVLERFCTGLPNGTVVLRQGCAHLQPFG